jgi:hypothetical protein
VAERLERAEAIYRAALDEAQAAGVEPPPYPVKTSRAKEEEERLRFDTEPGQRDRIDRVKNALIQWDSLQAPLIALWCSDVCRNRRHPGAVRSWRERLLGGKLASSV